MKKILLPLIILLMISLPALSQVSGPITLEKKGMRKSYMQNGEALTPKELVSVLKSNEASAGEYNAAKLNSIIGLSSMGVGTVFIGVGFINTIKAAQATNDGDLGASTDYSNKSSANLLIGAGFYALSLPFMIMSNSHLKKSINLYNSTARTGSIRQMDLYVGFTGNGASIQLRF